MHTHHETNTGGLGEMIDLDAEVLHQYLADATTWVIEQAAYPPKRIVDIGSGTGTGALALAHLVPDADVIAIDQSDEFLEHLKAKPGADRIHPIQADLDVAWPDIDPVDLVWASMSMHHMADPDRVLRDVH